MEDCQVNKYFRVAYDRHANAGVMKFEKRVRGRYRKNNRWREDEPCLHGGLENVFSISLI